MEKDRLISLLTFFYLARVVLLWLAIAVFIAIGGFWFIRSGWGVSRSQITEQAATIEVVTPSPEVSTTTPSTPAPVVRTSTVTVQPGDTLWAIAQRELGDGAQYAELARINGIENPRQLSIGSELYLPGKVVADSRDGVVDASQDQLHAAATDKSYLIQPGDCLWSIAEKQLGNPYRWVELYEANKAEIGINPDVIYPATSLVLPQPESATMLKVRK